MILIFSFCFLVLSRSYFFADCCAGECLGVVGFQDEKIDYCIKVHYWLLRAQNYVVTTLNLSVRIAGVLINHSLSQAFEMRLHVAVLKSTQNLCLAGCTWYYL